MIEAKAEHTTLAAQTPIPQISLVQDEKGGPHVFYAVQNGQSLALEQFPSFAAAARAAHTLLAKLPTLHGLRLSVEPGQWAMLGSMEPAPEREKALGGDLVTPREFAALLEVSSRTVERWRKEGRVRPAASTKGGHARYSLEQVERVREERWSGTWTVDPDPRRGSGPTWKDFAFIRRLLTLRRIQRMPARVRLAQEARPTPTPTTRRKR